MQQEQMSLLVWSVFYWEDNFAKLLDSIPSNDLKQEPFTRITTLLKQVKSNVDTKLVFDVCEAVKYIYQYFSKSEDHFSPAIKLV